MCKKMRKKKITKKEANGQVFRTKELAERRVEELRIYKRPALRIGRTVYEVTKWEQ